jgi:hypothetical protein
MELIEVINSSLVIFFSFISVTAVFSYVTYKIKDKSRLKSKAYKPQLNESPVEGIYPRILAAENNYKTPAEPVKVKRFNIFSLYSPNLTEKMHKLRLSSK